MMADLDLGQISNRILLTGAGFTKNWGGFLCVEFFQELMLIPEIRRNRELATLLREDPNNFESALFRCRKKRRLQRHYPDLENAVRQVYARMDERYSDISNQEGDLFAFSQFLGEFRSLERTALYFTLNQDLFFERHLHSKLVGVHPQYPSIPDAPCQTTTGFPRLPFDDSFVVRISNDVVATAMNSDFRGHFNYIKVHGSFNWTTEHGGYMMAIGGGKAKQIASSPLLSHYHRVFQQVMRKNGQRVLVIGYGFGDDHINQILTDSVANWDGELFVITNEDANALKFRLEEKPTTREIWKGVVPYRANLSDLLKHNSRSEWEKFKAAFLR